MTADLSGVQTIPLYYDSTEVCLYQTEKKKKKKNVQVLYLKS